MRGVLALSLVVASARALAPVPPAPRRRPILRAARRDLAVRRVATDLGSNRTCDVFEVSDRRWWRAPDTANPFGAKLWPGALAAAAALERVAAGRRVLEIGAGTGLCGLACAKCFGAAAVALTDVSDLALDLARRAADAQGLRCAVFPFDVCGDAPLPAGYDVLVAADLLYDADLARGGARRVLEARARGMEVVVGGSPDREGRSAFLATLRADLPHATFGAPVTVAHPQLKWKGKRVEVLHLPP